MNPYDKSKDSSLTDQNRDPITRQPGSHPVGTGVGAAAGGAAGIGAAAAAGAVAGTAAGPIGTGVGAAAGAVIGGLAGHAAGEHFNPTDSAQLERFIDYTVVDQTNDKIGTVEAVWQDHTGDPAYLAVRTGWLGMGKAHVVPAQNAAVDERKRKIRLPYTAEQIKNAPSFDSQDEITSDAEYSISSHFGTRRSRPDDDIVPPTKPQGEARVQLKSEEVQVGKRDVEYGGVRLRKVVRTEIVNQPVELTREEVVVERVPVKGAASATSDTFQDEEIYIPLRREEPVVQKTVSAREEVRVGKRTETEHRDIKEAVRHEDVEIERKADASGKSLR